MTGDGDTTARDPVDLLVERFLQLHRAGGGPSVEAFAAQHPEHADALRDLLPTLLALEGVKQDKASSGSGRRRASVPNLDRLGDFKIVGELGRGGMGVVFEAVQESLGRKVALKVLPRAGLLTGNQLERFRREAQIAAQLHHSNIVPVFGSGESDGYHWYAMQFIVGASLDRWRDEQSAARPQGSGAWRARARFVARIGEQAASALHYAHGLGTLHRDIKPANLLLEHNDHLWVTDFGLAKALEAEGLTHTGDILGTLQYMAPEQFAGSYDVRSEVYALGVTLYELLVLRPAFAGSTRSELMERIRTQRPESLRRACPEVPEDLAVVVEKAIARDPADRYPDAAALAHDLLAFLEDRPIEARRLSPVAVLWRWCRRNRAMAVLAASTFLAVLGAGVTGWVAYGIAGEERSKAVAAAVAEGRQKQAAEQQKVRAETTLRTALAAFGEVFDALVGKDPALAFEEDDDTGEQTVVARTMVEPRDLELLNRMLTFYGQFAAENAGNQVLQLETARAWRRVGAIRARLGKPEDLDAAQKAFQQSLERYAAITDRDVRREVAAVHVEFGQLKYRRLRTEEAEQSFQTAIGLLEALPNAATRAVRAERAKVHLASAASMAPRFGGGGPRGGQGPGSGRGPGEGRGEFDRDRLRRANEQVQAAVGLADGLLAEDPENLEFLALRARTHLTQARLSVRRERRPDADRPEGEAERGRHQRAAIDLLRQVVAKAPDRTDHMFDLVEALLESVLRRSGGGPGGPGGPGRERERDRNPAEVEARLTTLREALDHTETLVKALPDAVDVLALAARVGSEHGAALRDAAGLATGEERAARLRQAESALLAAVALETKLVAGANGADPRFVLQSVGTRRELAALYVTSGRRGEAVQQAAAVVDQFERLLVDAADPGAPNRRRLALLFDQRPLLGLEELLPRLQDADLQQRWQALRQQFPRPGEPPPDRRR